MRNADTRLVRELPLFSQMTSEHFDRLMGAALLQRFPERVILIREGEMPDFLHILIDGMVELFAAWNGRETIVEILRPVSTFILAAVIRDEVYLKSARTLTPSNVLMIPAQTVRDVFDRDAAFARAMVNELAARYRSIVSILKDQKLRSGIERVANWILEEEQRQGSRGRIVLPHDKRTLSSRLGMTPENLSRNLAALETCGVTTGGREIIVADRNALEHRARSPLASE